MIIVGEGNSGGALPRRITALGHNVSVANSRGTKSLVDLATETGAVPVPITEIGQGTDIVIVSIPHKSIPDLPTGILDALPEGAVVIDTGNYFPPQRDG